MHTRKRTLLGLALVGALNSHGATLTLPDGAIGFKFGRLVVEPLQSVTMQSQFGSAGDAGFVDTSGLVAGGGSWPDTLCGSYVLQSASKPFVFKAKVADGAYRALLGAGPVIKPDLPERRFLLKINDRTLTDETPSVEELASEKYLFRFLNTPCSLRPDRIWERFVNRMYPVASETVTVKDGTLTVEAANHFLSFLILVPEKNKAEFEALAASVRQMRTDAFTAWCKAPEFKPAEKQAGDGDYVLYAPREPNTLQPWSAPSADERKSGAAFDAAGAPGQHVLLVLAATPFADLGVCALELSDLRGPGLIPASAIECYARNFRFNGRDLPVRDKIPYMAESALVPAAAWPLESGVTHSWWLCLRVPDDAKAGQYKGAFTFRPGQGQPATVPVTFEVYPFKLAPVLPLAYGFWGTGHEMPFWDAARRKAVLTDRFKWLCEMGYSMVTAPNPSVSALKPDGTVQLKLDPVFFEAVRDSGLCRDPEHAVLDSNIMAWLGRQIGSRLPGSRSVFRAGNEGIELKQPEFKKYFLDGARQYRDFVKQYHLPLVVCAVDEPRERRINSWNRNYDDTVAYLDMLGEVGNIRRTVNPMRDIDHYINKPYTGFVAHCEVLGTHAWSNSKWFVSEVPKMAGKTLWLYNCGMDRYVWGFYVWAARARGQMQWHFYWASGENVGGYPGAEWYTPFTGGAGLNPPAPWPKFRGGLLHGSAMYTMADGIADYAYLYTLEQALKGPAASSPAGRAAQAFLDELRRAMPAHPELKGLAAGSDGSAVGLGAQDEARLHCADWRRTIAGHLKQMAR
jgi:hypothetical protein